jgi:secreted trypsin-like serine protease
MGNAHGRWWRRRAARRALLAALTAATGLVAAATGLAAAAGPAAAAADIIGGTAVAPGQLPSMAYVLFSTAAGQHFSCTGTVVAPTLVLTAAHCGFAYPSRYEIVIGVPNLDDAGPTNIFRVSAATPDPLYAGSPGTNDAALLTLTTPTAAPPVKLAAASVTAASLSGSPAQIAGWGSAVPGQAPINQLQTASTVIQSPSYCASIYATYNAGDQVCALDYPSDTAATCAGDSGGPLFLVAAGGPPVQVGIVGFGAGDCDPTIPDFFTAVSAVSPWIAAQIAAAADPPLVLTAAAARRTARHAVASALQAPGTAAHRPTRMRTTCSRSAPSQLSCLVSFRAGARSYVGTIVVRAVPAPVGDRAASGTFALRSWSNDCRARPLPPGATACTTRLHRGRVVLAQP